MSVFVDTLRVMGRTKNRQLFRCHLVGDTNAELENFAGVLGLAPGRIRRDSDKFVGIWHCNICDWERDKAIRLGAVPLLREEMMEKLEEIAERGPQCHVEM